MTTYVGSGAGQFRIAENALAGYEVYHGTDAEPDFAAAPWETSATLPHTTAALDVSHVHYLCVRYRNKYNLVSQNIISTSFDVAADGTISTVKPSDPVNTEIAAGAAGTFDVTSEYYYLEDGANAATQWLIYLTTNGSDPNPSVDSPTVVSMVSVDGISKLDWTSAASADGATGKVIVRTRRVDSGPTNVDSINSTVYSATADTDGPAGIAAACEFTIGAAGAFTTVWGDATARLDWLADPGVLRFYIGTTLVAAIGSSRILYLAGGVTELAYTSVTVQTDTIEWDAVNSCIVLSIGAAAPMARVAEISANGLRIAQVEELASYPIAGASATAYEWNASDESIDFHCDAANIAMRFWGLESGGIYNAKLNVKGVRENAL